MGQPIELTLSNPPVNANPQTVTDVFALVRAALSGEVPDPFTPYVVSSNVPTVDQQSYIWFKVDTSGRPLGIYVFYNGNWRRVNNGMEGEVRMYAGDPSVDFDGTGKGVVGGNWDGWALANGQNGTADLSDQFIVGAHMNNSGGVNGFSGSLWRSNVTGSIATQGGAKEQTIADNNLPKHEIKIVGQKQDSSPQSDAHFLSDPHYTPGDAASTTLTLDTIGVTTPAAIPTIPPFYALALVGWIGYD